MKRRILVQTIRDKINDLGLTSHARRVVEKTSHEGGVISYFARLKNQKRGLGRRRRRREKERNKKGSDNTMLES
jgi:hypothetical protein